MNHAETATPRTTMNRPDDTPFDTALRQHFAAAREPDDDGFSQRVMAALPARTAPRRTRWLAWAQYAQWTATSLAACGVAVLLPEGQAPLGAHAAAAYALIALLVFWAVPSRWSGG